MNNFFHQKFSIPCYDTDAAQLLKPVSFMNYAQEQANCHASILGFGYDDMVTTKTAWVLSRMHIKFFRHPKWRETVNMKTWHKGPQGLFYIRDFKMTDEKDETVLAAATTSWLVVNIDTHKLVREAILDEGSVCKDDAVSPACEKIRIPAGIGQEYVSSHAVSYSDLDLNGHANNAMYAVWSMDVLESGFALSHPLKELKINFNHEVKAGETVDLYLSRASEAEENKYWVEGRIRGNEASQVSSFIVEMIF